MIILDSARKHEISEADIKAVINKPKVIAELRDDPEKLLFLGFDSKAKAVEVITDTGTNGQVYIIHANRITKTYEKLLEELL